MNEILDIISKIIDMRNPIEFTYLLCSMVLIGFGIKYIIIQHTKIINLTKLVSKRDIQLIELKKIKK